MKIAVLTSSRADYGIYYPLLKALQNDPYFTTDIIAFGTHLHERFGLTIKEIESDGFTVEYPIKTEILGDEPKDISAHMGSVLQAFGSLYTQHTWDLVFALGDRYEMFAAVAASVPFNIPIAHIHGGETTLGAIDNSLRHCISIMSKYHFTTTEAYKNRVIELQGHSNGVYNVGALSIDNLLHTDLLSLEQFEQQFSIDLRPPTILITFHPETVSYEENARYTQELISALKEISDFQLVITMPNADTEGEKVRTILQEYLVSAPQVKWVESFGRLGYLSCMKHCSFLLGNTSSGFVEASFFPKFVINLGKRQDGRYRTPNIVDVPIDKSAILEAVKKIQDSPQPTPLKAYGEGNAAQQIVSLLKSI